MYRLKGLSLAAALVGLLPAAGFAWEYVSDAPVPSAPASSSPAPPTPVQPDSLIEDTAHYHVSSDGGSGLEIGGWLSSGFLANSRGTRDNGPLGFNSPTDFNLNQLWVYVEKATDTGGYGIDWGYRADFMFGMDADDTQAFGGLGWDTTWGTSSRYGFALPQLYAEVAINDLTIKAGHFYTLIGAEVVPAPDNFFYSHAYTMYYGEPFTHTGVLASYAWSDDVTIFGGWTQGWDTGFDNTPGADTFLGGISLPLTESLSLTWACTAGTFGPATPQKTALGLSDGDIYMNSFVFEWSLSDRWTYIFQHDLGVNRTAGGPQSEWYGVNQYLQCQISDTLAAGARLEWFRDDDGARISYNGLAVGNYGEVTLGVNWSPRERLVIRPEIRYDWFDGNAAVGALPFAGGSNSDQFTGGLDFYVTF